MVKKVALIVAILVASTQAGRAAHISLDRTSVADGRSFALTLNATTAEQFNSFRLVVQPLPELVNPGVGAWPTDIAGANKTFINPLLTFPAVIPGGQGLTIPFQNVTAHELVLEAGRLGGFIDASSGIFLANVVLPPTFGTGLYAVSLENAGVPIATLTGLIQDFPEPGTITLTSISLIGLIVRQKTFG